MVYVAMNAVTMRHSIISQKRVGERMSRRVVNSGRFTCSTAKVADMSTVPVKSKKGTLMGSFYNSICILYNVV